MNKITNLQKRHYRVRSKIMGTIERPRLSVSRSNKHIFAQVIDDENKKTLFGINSKYIKIDKEKFTKTLISEKLGTEIAKKALDLKINTVVFDRSGFKYHGRVKALADAARKAGLIF